MAKTKCTKYFMPPSKVKEKEYLARRLGCRGVGFSLVRYKPGQGAGHIHRHRVQEEIVMTLKGTGSIILDGRRHAAPEGTIVRIPPRVYRALGNDSKRDVVFLLAGGIPPKKFPHGNRTLFGDGIPDRKKVPSWKKR